MRMGWMLHPSRLLPLLIALPSASFAHQLDEYLQATLVEIEPTNIRIRINLTPGVEIADKVLSLLDGDGNGAITPSEIAQYGESLKRDLTVRLDGREVEVRFTHPKVLTMSELKSGDGILPMEYVLETGSLPAGAHRFGLENRHLPDISAYLFNAARPAVSSIQVTKQTRNQNQSRGEIEFSVEPAAKSSRVAARLASVAGLIVLFGWLWRMNRKRDTQTGASAGSGLIT
jgi:hypothetical protein